MKHPGGILGTIIRLKRMHDRGYAMTIVLKDGKTAAFSTSVANGYEIAQEMIDQDPRMIVNRAGLEMSINYAVVPPLNVLAEFSSREPVVVDVAPGIFALWKADPEAVVDDIISSMAMESEPGYPAWVAAEAELQAGKGIVDEIVSLSGSTTDLKKWVAALQDSSFAELVELGNHLQSNWARWDAETRDGGHTDPSASWNAR